MTRFLQNIISIVFCCLINVKVNAGVTHICGDNFKSPVSLKNTLKSVDLEFIENKDLLLEQLNNKLNQTPSNELTQRFLIDYAKARILFSDKNHKKSNEICRKLIYDSSSLSCSHFYSLLQMYFSSILGEDRYSQIVDVLDFLRKNKPDIPKEYIYGHLGNTYYHLGLYSLAIVNFKHAIELEKYDIGTKAGLHNNIGLAYANINNKVLANSHFEKALALWNKKPEEERIAAHVYAQFKDVIKNNILSLDVDSVQDDHLIYSALKKEYLMLSQDEKLSILNINIPFLLDMAELAFKVKNYSDGNTYINQIDKKLSSGDRLGIENESRYEFLCLLRRILNKDIDGAIEQSNRYKKAIQVFQERRKELYLKTNPIDNEWKTKVLTEREKALTAERQFKVVLYLLLSILIVFLVLIYKGYTSQKQSRKQIAYQKKQLEKALKNTEMLLKEVHHRVKNNLQLVTSIAYIEYEKNDENFDFQGFENRIISLSLIHRLLYSTDDISDISFDVYLKDLMLNLENTSLGEFNYNLKIEPVHLPLEHAITFGLLINELVTNTIKHCIPESGDKKHISISFLKKEEQWCLHYKDNGSVFKTSENNHFNLGDSLIELLIHKLRGKHDFTFDNGYNLHIYLKHIQPV